MDRYLHPGDYTFQIRKEIKDLLGGVDEGKLILAENAAVDEMRSYLKKRYDITRIFYLIKKHEAGVAWPTGSRVYFKQGTDPDEKYQVWESLVNIPSNQTPPGSDATKWQLFTLRNPFVMMYLVDITLYHLHSKDASRLMPKVREDRYTDAQSWLKMVGRGEIDANLPVLPPDDIGYVSEIRFNSNPVENQRW
jgi:phage gp36-like protein